MVRAPWPPMEWPKMPFQTFRKENYYQTVASIKDLKMRQAEEDATKKAELEAQEKASRFAKTMKRSDSRKGYGNQN